MSTQLISDAQLVSEYKNGNEKSFATLLNRHQAKIFTSIYLIVKDKARAEDIIQDAFIKAINKIKAGKYNEEGKFLPWIIRIAKNLAIDSFRKAKKMPTVNSEKGDDLFERLNIEDNSTINHESEYEKATFVRLLIKQLPEEQREVLVMRHFADMSFKEIADQTGVSINTALGRMRYALINLRKCMDQNEFAYGKDLYFDK